MVQLPTPHTDPQRHTAQRYRQTYVCGIIPRACSSRIGQKCPTWYTMLQRRALYNPGNRPCWVYMQTYTAAVQSWNGQEDASVTWLKTAKACAAKHVINTSSITIRIECVASGHRQGTPDNMQNDENKNLSVVTHDPATASFDDCHIMATSNVGSNM